MTRANVDRSELLRWLIELRRAQRTAAESADAPIESVIADLAAKLGGSVSQVEAAGALTVSPTAVRKLLASGELLAVRARPGAAPSVDLAELLELTDHIPADAGDGRRWLASTLRGRLARSARDLASDTGVSPAQIADWIRNGTVRAENRASGLEVSDPERDWTMSHGELLRGLTEQLRFEPSVELVVLFGSSARGDDREDSDVDLIVDGSFRSDTRHRLRTLGRLYEVLPRTVQTLTLDELESVPELAKSARRDGRVLVDRRGVWNTNDVPAAA